MFFNRLFVKILSCDCPVNAPEQPTVELSQEDKNNGFTGYDIKYKDPNKAKINVTAEEGWHFINYDEILIKGGYGRDSDKANHDLDLYKSLIQKDDMIGKQWIDAEGKTRTVYALDNIPSNGEKQKYMILTDTGVMRNIDQRSIIDMAYKTTPKGKSEYQKKMNDLYLKDENERLLKEKIEAKEKLVDEKLSKFTNKNFTPMQEAKVKNELTKTVNSDAHGAIPVHEWIDELVKRGDRPVEDIVSKYSTLTEKGKRLLNDRQRDNAINQQVTVYRIKGSDGGYYDLNKTQYQYAQYLIGTNTVTPEPIVITGKELGDFPDTEEGKKALRSAVKTHLMAMRGDWVDCPIISKKIEIRNRGIKESLARSGDPRKLKLLVGIKGIIKSATEFTHEINHKPAQKPDVISYYKLKSKAVLEGNDISLTLVVEEDKGGLLITT